MNDRIQEIRNRRDLSGISPSDKAIEKLFKLLTIKQNENQKLINRIEEVKKLLLKGKVDEALQIIVKGD